MKFTNFKVLLFALFSVISLHAAGGSVSINGIPNDKLDAYYAGVAKVYESSAKLNFISNGGVNDDDLAVFHASSALNPVSSILQLLQVNDGLKFYQDGVFETANVSSASPYKSCIPPSKVITRDDIAVAINAKFEGSFDYEKIGILIVGVFEFFSEKYPCV